MLTFVDGAYRVVGVPLLWQSDPHIKDATTDEKVLAGEGVACYLTSIVMAADGALINRNPGYASLTGRSAIFNALTGSANAQGTTVSRELKQQVWESETQLANDAGTGVVYYLHELVADQRSAFDVLTPWKKAIFQAQDPFTYGLCTVASNIHGAAFRGWFNRQDYLTNSYFTYLLNAGFIPIYAFDRYTPTAEQLPDGTWHVTLQKTESKHKVVVTGYRTTGAFPMVLNDPGSGQHADVTFSRVLDGRGYGNDQARGGAISKVTFLDTDGSAEDRVMNTHMLYATDLGAGVAVNMVEHVDGVSLNWTPSELVFHGKWAPGWTHLVPFQLDGVPHLLAYNRTNGSVQIAGFFANQQGVMAQWQGTWGTWSHLAIATVGGVPYLVTYNADSHQVMVSSFFTNLQGVQTVWSGTWGQWSHLVPVSGPYGDYLVTYNAANGQLMTSRWFGGMHGTQTVWTGEAGSGWTDVKPSRLDGQDALLFFNRGSGESAFRLVDEHLACGASQPLFDPVPGGATFEPLPFDGPVNLSIWKAADASLEIHRRWAGNTPGSYPYALIGRTAPFPALGGKSDKVVSASVTLSGQFLQLFYWTDSGEVAFARLRPF